MFIPVQIKSNISGRIITSEISARSLIDIFGEDHLIEEITSCNCQPVGETNVVECDCYEEWIDCKILIGDEIKKNHIKNA